MSDVTQLLSAIDQGDSSAADKLFSLVYDELRALAAQKMAQEKPNQTLQATALVHEAYLRLVRSDQGAKWQSRGHFFTAAAEAMRRILINRARDKKALKRGGEWQRVNLDQLADVDNASPEDLLALNDALEQLARENKQCADLVKLRFFVGMTLTQAAAALGISPRSADRLWAFARSWLFQALSPS
jgi:RNA polymerase sigma factor (TIGR02999 family)